MGSWFGLLVTSPLPRSPARTKGAPITQGITRVVGALCQKLGGETSYIFAMMAHLHKATQPGWWQSWDFTAALLRVSDSFYFAQLCGDRMLLDRQRTARAIFPLSSLFLPCSVSFVHPVSLPRTLWVIGMCHTLVQLGIMATLPVPKTASSFSFWAHGRLTSH